MSLKYFQYVARYRNFSRAAEHFYIGQSALSRQIANLEKELGVQLFHRDTRNVNLTDAGQTLYDDCDLLLRHHDVVTRRMEAAHRGYEGQLSIATVAIFGSTFLDYARRFIELYPQVKLRVDDLPFEQLSTSILNGIYDAAFTLDFEVPDNDQLVRTVISQDHFVVVTDPAGPLDLGATTTSARLLDEHLVIPRTIDPPFLRTLRLLGRDHGGTGSVDTVPNTTTALLRVDLGLGITLVPRLVVDAWSERDRYRVSEIEDLDTRFSTVLVRRRDNEQVTLRNLVALVREGRAHSSRP